MTEELPQQQKLQTSIAWMDNKCKNSSDVETQQQVHTHAHTYIDNTKSGETPHSPRTLTIANGSRATTAVTNKQKKSAQTNHEQAIKF